MTVEQIGGGSTISPPEYYLRFIADARKFVESRGLVWSIPLDCQGVPLKGHDWDLRRLTDSFSRVASYTNGFAVDSSVRDAAVSAGWSAASLPSGAALSPDVQEFLKAVIAHRCQQKKEPRGIRARARTYRMFFSSVAKAPWDVASEDFERFVTLPTGVKEVGVALLSLVRIINHGLLSVNCPLVFVPKKQVVDQLAQSLEERKSGGKLPEATAFYELTRIVFQEKPRSHLDLIRFLLIRLLILTGLRLQEVMMLPRDCLQWEETADCVTGKPANEVGGIRRGLWLKYFAEKHRAGRPDLLVEARQGVPAVFQQPVVEAVTLALRATKVLSHVLAEQRCQGQAKNSGSDLRQFRTSSGRTLFTEDFLFLTILQWRQKPLPKHIPFGVPIVPITLSAVYNGLGSNGGNATLFCTYGRTAEASEMKLTPKSLRHLLNTELFRLHIADTIITKHFGRKAVAQSYEYDHRTLAEGLAFVQLPEGAANFVPPGHPAELVARMVVSGGIEESHIAKTFRLIQAEHGDEHAFAYLAASADGFHVTPYGFCVNSFALNPCARHLRCFDDCRHFVPSGRTEHRVNLERLLARLRSMRDEVADKPAKTVGRQNQLAHAEGLIRGVEATLAAQPGTVLFPDGPDHSAPAPDLFQ